MQDFVPILIIIVTFQGRDTSELREVYTFSPTHTYHKMDVTEEVSPDSTISYTRQEYWEDYADSLQYVYIPAGPDESADSTSSRRQPFADASWPVRPLPPLSNLNPIQELSRTLVRTFDHSFLDEGSCYEYSLLYKQRRGVSSSPRRLHHHIYCDAPPEMSSRQRAIIGNRLEYRPELILYHVRGKPVLLMRSYYQSYDKYGIPFALSLDIGVRMMYRDTLDVAVAKEEFVSKVDSAVRRP
jgi:hypothetical protein